MTCLRERPSAIVLDRRTVLAAGAAGALAAAAPAGFGFADVSAKAQALAARAYAPPDTQLPPALAELNYDDYRQVGFRDEQALWADAGLPFRVQFFHRGWLFRERVDVFEVVDGQATPIAYDPAMFRHGAEPLSNLVRIDDPNLGFSGLRLLHPLNRGDKFDEIAAFLGASYFRAVARGGVYGASARGLAIGAGDPGEEFPRFTTFWLVRPRRGDRQVTLYALLDSQSLAGAYQFVITPGEPTMTAVRAELHPRVETPRVGLAPLTSMFLYDPQSARAYDDHRPRVHDSDGLAIANSSGERLWRVLENPKQIQASGFADPRPSQFGLMQRAAGFSAYEDLEARYDLRPSMWVSPKAGFGPGEVRLVELPAPDETYDNLVAEWRLAEPLRPGRRIEFAYDLAWGRNFPLPPGAVRRWRESAGDDPGWRRLLIDFGPLDGAPEPRIEAGGHPVRHVALSANTAEGGWRLAFEFAPQEAGIIELRAQLAGAQTSEAWMHRWLA